ncbi:MULTISPECIES: hypothetical protein [unclassified Buttiauxella]|uniref:hypothetical protein n=1 Tax=unclassified Buttiauxella TaxID=2634062 RepID=UPI001E42D52C|nr:MULTISPECIES: hypothetical protein [unclassified Buttiauxella]MCE0798952.1 hypothetical protein [Buttiauxella sp. W03-F01]MCE0811545.1 hypothetical protein [Buttiauxella sp. S04-F03]
MKRFIYLNLIYLQLIATLLLLPGFVYAGVSNIIEGYAIVGVSTQVTTINNHEVPINVEKSFTSGSGQLLIKAKMPNSIVVLTNERGSTISLSQGAALDGTSGNEQNWHFRYESGFSSPIYDYPACNPVSATVGKSGSITFRGAAECNYASTRGPDHIHYTALIFGARSVVGFPTNWDLRTPATEPGIYRGSIYYTLGPGKDFDMGPEAIYHTDRIEIPFVVYVSTVPMKLRLPPGSERAVLTPQDGWSSWINRSVKPDRIYRNIPFTITAQGWVAVSLENCSYLSSNICQISDGKGNLANLNVSITLPEPWRNYPGSSVNKHPVTTYKGAYSSYLLAGLTPVTSSGKLTIEVAGGELDKMLTQPGSEWSGNITVVFEQMLDF